MSEEILIRNCAPTLAGIKTGNLFRCSYGSKRKIVADIRSLNRRLVPKGLRILPLRYTADWALIYVYRPADLAADLSNADAHTLLCEAGYPCGCVNRCVIELIHRINQTELFPHEIGLFLGYPPEDVRGFIENKGQACKCAGCWKVYGDAGKAAKTFEQYRQCTKCYFSRWKKGTAVERLAVEHSEKPQRQFKIYPQMVSKKHKKSRGYFYE